MTEDAFTVRTLHLDLPALAGELGRRLREAGMPVTPARSAQFARALALVRPVSKRALYWTARATYVTDASELKAFNAVFAAVFGGREHADAEADREREGTPLALEDVSVSTAGSREGEDVRDLEVPIAASDEEVLRQRHFDALEPGELAQLYRLMSRLEVATPRRRTRRAERQRRCAAACAPPATRFASRAAAGV
jgi:uncharacterized protein with von Willebrand factor type A (vWA) domain